jgi:hypothetical protein
VVNAIFEIVERRRFEITVPRRSPALILARSLRRHCPALLRWAMTRFEPVDPSAFQDLASKTAVGETPAASPELARNRSAPGTLRK